ncbi:FAD-dependent oxidoreductase [Mycolicibacterium sp. CH28]|uniref:NAD(P)/FAD-dependent oxidoreductase n=1 Tax=Mycolicibacterium sp. CH28 TaxID=2512237 RepID=UPI0010817DAA|nr:FAD-binding oxidoreductase [Mycolicibacterium sp. CH28]TGD90765.1 FAD-dependent oxidoreductase [Mycolicibacterium sp. CH28]
MTTHPDATIGRYRSKSLWFDQVGDELIRRAGLARDVDCDVAIVGGGFTGLWTAYYLSVHAPQLRIVVLEAETVGFGASGRNGGWAGGGIAGSQRRYAQRHGWDAARRAVAESNAAVHEIGAVVSAEEIDCDFSRQGTLVAATSRPQADRLRSWFDDQRAQGMLGDGERLLGPGECTQFANVPSTQLGFYTPYCAGIQPVRLVRGLAHACERRGVTVFEGTAAVAIRQGGVETTRGLVRARYVVRATESYTTLLPGQKRRYLPLTSLMVATAPVSQRQWDEIGMAPGMTVKDKHHLFFYAQRTKDDRLVIGGRGAPYSLRAPMAESRETNDDVRDRLVRTIAANFPAAATAPVTHHWGGTLAVPRDWCMSVSIDHRTGLASAGGYSGHGVVATNIAGRTLADLVLGRDTPLVTMPWVNHRSRSWEPEPIRYLASQAIVGITGSADGYEDRHERTARRTSLIKPFLPPG